MSRRHRAGPQPHHACAIRALRALGYRWVRVPNRYRRDQWLLLSPRERWYGAAFGLHWDIHDYVRLRTPFGQAERNLGLLTESTPQAMTKLANATMAEFRRMAELSMVNSPRWGVTMGPGGSSRDRRRARRATARLMEAARREAVSLPRATTVQFDDEEVPF